RAGQWLDNDDSQPRMDLLTALLHEIGHTLGLDHHPDPASLMAETLAPNTRKFADDLDSLFATEQDWLSAPAP
ncbi:MAG: matrixin family metalloprotease, partial [Planctomycetales bacterium]|nr:matrixin family metalloprotease [Planctomycetales bacterium]